MYACVSECSCRAMHDSRKLFCADGKVNKDALEHATVSESGTCCAFIETTAYAHPSFPPGIDQYRIKPTTPAKAPVTSA